ncbi:MAG: ATP-binding protein [Cyanobacteriota bacterium]
MRLGAIREQLDGLLEEAARRQLNLREALAWLCAAEVTSKEQRRLSMALTIAHFPFVRTLEGFEFEAQPSIDPGKIPPVSGKLSTRIDQSTRGPTEPV